MRMFDKRTSWLDDEGKPLVGRVKFCKLHTTILENIYNMNGTVVYANPQYTNTIGQLHYQVFLKDNTDYTVRFEKYVGNGDMTEDQDNWLDVYSCDDIWNTYGIEIDATSFQVVNNITALRNLDPSTVATRDNHKVVILAGYYNIGDKPQVMYIWNPNTTSSDNGGDIIKVNSISNGRWELVNNFGPDGLDVRHFGVFGADSKSEATDLMSIQINVANQYAAYNSIPLYFPTIDGLTWYKMNGLNLYNSVFAEGTRVFGNSNYPNIITMNDENGYLDCYSDSTYHAVFRIRGEVVRTSWGENTDNCFYEPSYKLIVDSVINTNNKDWSNIIVECISEISHAQFDNCEIHAVKKLGDWIYFSNCKLEEKMFLDGTDFDTITIHNNDIIDLADWPTTWKWMHLRSQLANTTVDFQGRTIDSTFEFGWTISATYKNAVFSNYTAIHNTVTLDHCSGTIIIPNAKNIYITNGSNVEITNTDTELTAVGIVDSTVRLDYGTDILITNLALKNSTLDDQFNKVINTYNFTAEHSKVFPFIVMMTVGSTNCIAEYSDVTTINTGKIKSIIQNCVIYRGIVSRENESGNIDFDLINNVFLNYDAQSFGHHIASDTHANAHVIGRWVNNNSMLPGHFITIDRTNIDLDEQTHSYVYESNTGPNVLQRCESNWSDIQIFGGTQGSPKVITGAQRWESGPFAIRFNGSMFRNDENGGGHTNPDVYLTQFTMFTVGTRNIGQLALTCIPPQHLEGDFYNSPRDLWVTSNPTSVDEKERLWYSSNVGTPAGIMFIGGYTWRITHVYHMYELNNYANMPAYFELPVNYHISKY